VVPRRCDDRLQPWIRLPSKRPDGDGRPDLPVAEIVHPQRLPRENDGGRNSGTVARPRHPRGGAADDRGLGIVLWPRRGLGVGAQYVQFIRQLLTWTGALA